MQIHDAGAESGGLLEIETCGAERGEIRREFGRKEERIRLGKISLGVPYVYNNGKYRHCCCMGKQAQVHLAFLLSEPRTKKGK